MGTAASPVHLEPHGSPASPVLPAPPAGQLADDQQAAPALLPDAVAVRDSKEPDGPRLTFTSAAWAAFTATIRTGA
ncbi:MAG TPA: DUF397 domain-containing protein [Streptosporangiaceae bacterium]